MKSLILLLIPMVSFSQFAPQAGQTGSTAIFKDSSVFKNWATNCTVSFGLKDIANPSLGTAGVGTGVNAVGKAGTNGTVSLGDAGTAVLTFERPITNGPGADFAVFENGFNTSKNLDFLELAFVEVSSDGINFFRFPVEYNGDTVNQHGPFQPTDTRNYNNLAGKYIAGYGTPFDLQELANTSGLDINQITHVRVIDVVGTVNAQYATRDSKGRKINDPYPTDFAPGGFDLDAVGVIHQTEPLGNVLSESLNLFKMFPNPSTGKITIESEFELGYIRVNDSNGNTLFQSRLNDSTVDVSFLSAGVYYVLVENEQQKWVQKLIIL